MNSQWMLVGPLNDLKQELRLKEGITKIGRGNSNDIVINKSEVSRQHCRIEIQNDLITLMDLKSFNGCFVGKNKIPINQPWHLSSGDKVGFGVETASDQFSDLVFQIIKKKISSDENCANNGSKNEIDDDYEDMLSSDDSDIDSEHIYYVPKICSPSTSNLSTSGTESKVIQLNNNSSNKTPVRRISKSTESKKFSNEPKICMPSSSNVSNSVESKLIQIKPIDSSTEAKIEGNSKNTESKKVPNIPKICTSSTSNTVSKNESKIQLKPIDSSSETSVRRRSKSTESKKFSNEPKICTSSTSNTVSKNESKVIQIKPTDSSTKTSVRRNSQSKEAKRVPDPLTYKNFIEPKVILKPINFCIENKIEGNSKDTKTEKVPNVHKISTPSTSNIVSKNESKLIQIKAMDSSIKTSVRRNSQSTEPTKVPNVLKMPSTSNVVSKNIIESKVHQIKLMDSSNEKPVKVNSKSTEPTKVPNVLKMPSTSNIVSKNSIESKPTQIKPMDSSNEKLVKVNSKSTEPTKVPNLLKMPSTSNTVSKNSIESKVPQIKPMDSSIKTSVRSNSQSTEPAKVPNVPQSTEPTKVPNVLKMPSTSNAVSKNSIESKLSQTKPMDSSNEKPVKVNSKSTKPETPEILNTSIDEYTETSDVIEIDDSDEEISLSQFFSVPSIKTEIKQEFFEPELIDDDDDDDFSQVFSQDLSFNDNQTFKYFGRSMSQNKKQVDLSYLISEDEDDESNKLIIEENKKSSSLISEEEDERESAKLVIEQNKKRVSYLTSKDKEPKSNKLVIIEPKQRKKATRKKHEKKPFCSKAEKKKVIESRREKLKELALKNQASTSTHTEKKSADIKIVRNISRSEFLSKENDKPETLKRKIDKKNTEDVKKIKLDPAKDLKKRKIEEENVEDVKKIKIDEQSKTEHIILKVKNSKNVTFSAQLTQIFEIPAYGKMKKVSHQREFLPKEPLNLEPTKVNWSYEITHSQVVHTMCKWNTNWLQECKSITKDPPLLNYPPLRVEDKYNSYELYRHSMYPLLMSEIWSEIVREKDLQDSNEKNFGVLHGVVERASMFNVMGKNIVLCRCLMVGDAEIIKNNLSPKYADFSIIQINFPNDAKKIIFNIFSVVSNSPRFTPLSHCKDKKFLNYLNSTLKLKNGNFIIKPSGYCCVELVLAPISTAPKIDQGLIIKLRRIKNIGKELKLAKSVFKVEKSSLCQIIINPMEYIPVPELSHKDKLITTFKLNEAQEKAVLCISRSILSKTPSISLIHGPPGTGKTHVITTLIQQVLYHTREKSKTKKMSKILLCTPSNSALDEVVLRLMDIRKNLSCHKFKLTRCGNIDTMHRTVRDISPQFLAQKKVNTDLDHSNVEIELNLLRAKEYAYKLAFKNETDGRFVEKISTIQEKIIEFEKLSAGNGPQNNYLRNKMLIDEENAVIYNAEIIATTLSSCYSKKIVDSLSDSVDISFSCCIIDEATQAIEPEVLMPLLHKIDNIVLVGDPCQLPATVCSQTSKNFSFDTSIFHRLYNCWKNNENTPLYRLYHQHRMHPEIADFPSKNFYDGFLKTPSFLDVKLPFMPYLLIEHKFLQDPQGEMNKQEGELILEIMYALGNQSVFDKMNLGVIVPYQKQKNFIQDLLKKGEKPKHTYMLNTIDSFQGKEKDIVIVSCVRTDGIGFLSDKQRINVALTRAKKCLLIIGNFSCLQKNDTWNSLISDAKSRNVYYSLESQNIHDSVKSLFKHITKIPM